MLWLEGLFWHHCNNRFSNLENRGSGLLFRRNYCIYHRHKLAPCTSSAALCRRSNFLIPVSLSLITWKCTCKLYFTLNSMLSVWSSHPQGTPVERLNCTKASRYWERLGPDDLRTNRTGIIYLLLLQAFFLSVFVLQLSITLCNMTHSALKTIPQAHQGFIFLVVEVIDYRPGGE